MLGVVLDVLISVHQQACGGWPPPADVRGVLETARRRVLAGVCVAFSRVIPPEQEPASHPLWRMAERFGATCSMGMGEEVTHVVAAAEGTDKV